MKVFILLFMPFTVFGQTQMAVFVKGQGWVYKTFPDSAATAQAIAAKVDQSTLSTTVQTTVSSATFGWSQVTSKPTTIAGYGLTDAAALNHSHSFASLISPPTTLAGYGITDASASNHTHTFASLTSKPTTLSGFGITDGATLASPTFTGTVTLPASTVTNAMLAGSIDLTTKVTGILPFANNAGQTAATSATTGTMTVNMTTPIITITPTNACTFNGSGGVTGQRATFVITTSGTSSFTLTWGTNFKPTGTLATGTTTAKIFAVSFLCTNGTQWIETSRTTAE